MRGGIQRKQGGGRGQGRGRGRGSVRMRGGIQRGQGGGRGRVRMRGGIRREEGGGRGQGRGRGRGRPVGGLGHAERIRKPNLCNEIRATIVDHVINHGLTLREAGLRVQPNLSRYTVASTVRTFRQEHR